MEPQLEFQIKYSHLTNIKKNQNPVVHFEIPFDEEKRTIKFYQEVFDWKIEKMEMSANSASGGDPYFIVKTTETDENDLPKKPGGINGGMMQRKHPSQPLINYIDTKSIEKSLELIKASGGNICMPKTEISPDMGWIAIFTDTEGNMMGLYQLADGMKND